MTDELEKDLWQTPKDLFDMLNKQYNFDIDLCASAGNNKCKQFCADLLNVPTDWLIGNRAAFMNPPYSNPAPFLEKAWELSQHCLVVVLIPSSIKHNKYMNFLDVHGGRAYLRFWKKGIKWYDIAGRTKFVHPTKKSSSPAFGCSILVLDRRNIS